MSQRRPDLRLLAPLLALLIPAVWFIASSGFRGLYGQDPYAYYNYAVGPLRDSLLALEWPPPPFHWPPGYPLAVSLLSLPFGTTPLAGQLASLLGGALVVLFTALLAAELWPEQRATALLAGLFAALNGQLWQSSVVVMSDTVGLAAATLGMWALARYGRTGRGGWLALASGALAYAVLTRWALALVAVVALLYALYLLLRQPRPRAAGHALLATAVALLILSPVLGGVVRLLSGGTAAGPSFTVDLEVVTWNPLNAFQRSFVTSDGLLQYRLPNGLYYLLAPARSFYLSPLLAAILPIGLWQVLRRRTAASLFLLMGWAGLVYLFLAGIPWQNFRFTLTYLPPLAILAAAGATAVAGQLAAANRVRWRIVWAGWLAAGLLWAAGAGYTLTAGFIDTMQGNVEIVRWATAQTPADARLIAFALAQTAAYESGWETYNLYLLAEQELAALVADDRPLYLLVNEEAVQRQWTGRSPAENLRWLRENPGLEEIGRMPPYTLFRVAPAGSTEGD